MQIQGVVAAGANAQSAGPGTILNLRQGQLGDVIVSELQARYYEQTYRKNKFSWANPAAVTPSATFAGTAPTSTLYNLPGASVNLVLTKVSALFAAAPAGAVVVGLVAGFNGAAPTGITAGTPISNFLGGAVGQGKVATAITLGTAPALILPILAVEAASSITPAGGFIDVGGSIIIPPGGYVAVSANAAASIFAGFEWDEVPV